MLRGAKRLTREQVWIARLRQAACSEQKALTRLVSVSSDPARNRDRLRATGSRDLERPSSETRGESPFAVEKQEKRGVPV